MASGTLSLGNVTDEQFTKLIQIKDTSGGNLSFVPNQSITPITVQSGGSNVPGFSNIVLQFSNAPGIKAAAAVLEMLGA